MSVVLTGSNGQLGQCIQDECKQLGIHLHPLTKKYMPIEDSSQVDYIFNKLQPSIVINTAAYTNVDKAETDIDEAFMVNAAGPEILGHACNKRGIPLIHISTDFVFDGKSKKKYIPQDKPNPTSIYGKSKLLGEENIIKICKKFYIIRTSWVFSNYGNNFLKTILKLGNTKDELSLIDDQVGCPTSANDLAKAIVRNLENFKSGKNNNSIYHYSGDQSCSWFDFAKFILKKGHELGYIQSMPSIKPIHTIHYKALVATRPQFSALDSSCFCKTFNVQTSDWKTAVEKIIEELCLAK